MSASPPAYRPPSPHDQHPGHYAAIALLIVALIVIVAVVGVIYSIHIISHNVSVSEQQSVSGSKEVSVKTPVGNFHLNTSQQADPAIIGLPVYPGAQKSADSNSPRVSLNLPGITSVDVAAVHFATAASIGAVESYYQTQLKGQITKIKSEDSGNRIALEIKRDDDEKIVALKRTGSGTAITLVRVVHGPGEVN